MRTRSTVWFQRGVGALYKWTPIPSPTDSSTFTGWPTSEFRWVQLSGDKRDYLCVIETTSDTSEGTIIQPGGAGGRHVVSDDFQYTMQLVNTTGQNRIMGPVMAMPSNATNAAAHMVLAVPEWGFQRVRLVGPAASKFAQVNSLATSTTSSDPQALLCATTYSHLGENSALVAFVAESSASEGDRLAEVFMRADLTSILHAEQ